MTATSQVQARLLPTVNAAAAMVSSSDRVIPRGGTS
jgi:hypothetical protein